MVLRGGCGGGAPAKKRMRFFLAEKIFIFFAPASAESSQKIIEKFNGSLRLAPRAPDSRLAGPFAATDSI